MAVTFVIVPQWQGSGSSRAMRLVEGAKVIQDDLPASSTVVIDIPLEAGDDQGTRVSRLSSLREVRDRQALVLSHVPDWALTIGGDCGVELASVGHVAASGEVALLWFDAHPDVHTPESSSSSAFHGMVLRTLIGDGDPALVPAAVLPADRVLLLGTRAFDVAEAEYVAADGPSTIAPGDLTPEVLLAAIEATGASSVYVHIDLDVLDPSEITGIGYPEPFGLTSAALIELVRAVKARYRIVGAGITEFAPVSSEQALDDMPTILRLIGALTR